MCENSKNLKMENHQNYIKKYAIPKQTTHEKSINSSLNTSLSSYDSWKNFVQSCRTPLNSMNSTTNFSQQKKQPISKDAATSPIKWNSPSKLLELMSKNDAKNKEKINSTENYTKNKEKINLTLNDLPRMMAKTSSPKSSYSVERKSSNKCFSYQKLNESLSSTSSSDLYEKGNLKSSEKLDAVGKGREIHFGMSPEKVDKESPQRIVKENPLKVHKENLQNIPKMISQNISKENPSNIHNMTPTNIPKESLPKSSGSNDGNSFLIKAINAQKLTQKENQKNKKSGNETPFSLKRIEVESKEKSLKDHAIEKSSTGSKPVISKSVSSDSCKEQNPEKSENFGEFLQRARGRGISWVSEDPRPSLQVVSKVHSDVLKKKPEFLDKSKIAHKWHQTNPFRDDFLSRNDQKNENPKYERQKPFLSSRFGGDNRKVENSFDLRKFVRENQVTISIGEISTQKFQEKQKESDFLSENDWSRRTNDGTDTRKSKTVKSRWERFFFNIDE